MKLQKRYDNQLLQLNNLQEQLEKANKSQTEVFREMNDSMRESEKKFANSQHELSFQQQLVRKLQLQIQELQALIAAREKERMYLYFYVDVFLLVIFVARNWSILIVRMLMVLWKKKLQKRD
jgi:hypothetical protein